MFHFDKKNSKDDSKCYLTYGKLGHLDPKQPPVKRKPFASLLNQPFVHQAELILPVEVYEIIKDELEARISKPGYSRVILPLKALLEGEFFNKYIKRGNIIMLSRGLLGVENVYSLRSGILTLTLDRATYERCGITGTPWGPKGSRNLKPRWTVEINLRLPSMLHGKKGFERILHAFQTVLVEEVEWLFCHLEGKELSPDPLTQHHPVRVTASPTVFKTPEIKIPELKIQDESSDDSDSSTIEYANEFGDYATELYEWLSLISLSSPRVNANDQVDSFLSRYALPSSHPDSILEQAELVKITWSGFLSSKWIHDSFVKILLATGKIPGEKTWFSYGVCGFHNSWSSDSRDILILKLPKSSSGEYILWDISQPQ